MDVTVLGTAEFSVPPERGTAHVVVAFEGDVMAPAVAQTNAVVTDLNGVLEQLRSGGAATWHAVGPLGTRSWRPFNNQGQVMPLRHAATVRVSAKFRDFQALARFLTDWGARDGVRVEGVEWTLTEARRDGLQAEILARAVADARRRALVMAKAAGAGDVVAVEVADPGLLSGLAGGGAPPQPFAAAMRASAPGDAGVIAPEDVTGTATVHARFRTTNG